MKCNLGWCSIAIVFLVANIYVSYFASSPALKKNLDATLSPQQREQYRGIVSERRDIYYKGYIYGLILSVVLALYARSTMKNMTNAHIACLVGAVTMLTNYFYYILSPKSEYMVIGLDRKDQREAWHAIYRHMQVQYHVGLVLGILAAMAGAYALC